MKTPIYFIALVTILLTDFYASADDNKIKIGVATALSGEGASWGFDIRDSLLFANDRLTNNKYSLIFQDDKCDPKEGLTATKELIEFSKVRYALGYTCSGPAMVSAPLFNKAKVPLIVTSASTPQLKAAGDFIFRTMPSDALGSKLLVDYLVKENKSSEIKLAVISTESEYAQDLKNAFLDNLDESGMNKGVLKEDFSPNTTDFRSILLKLKARGVNTIFVNVQFEKSLLIVLRQLKEYKWAPKLLAAYHPANQVVLSARPDNLEGIVFYDSPDLSKILTTDGKAILEEYKSKYGELRSSEIVFIANYEGMRALDQAISSGGDIKAYLEKTEFNGIFGPWHFDHNGEIVGLNFSLKTIKDFKVQEMEQ